MTKSKLSTWLLMLPSTGMLALLVVAPLAVLVFASLIQGNNLALDAALSLGNYATILEKGLFFPLMGKSLAMAGSVTAACILLAYPTAYGLAKCVGEKHRNLLVVLIIIPFFTSQLLLIYSMMVLLQANGPVMSLLGLFGRNASTSILYTNFAVFLILLYEFLPYMVLCLYSSMCKIEDNQLYAAQVMGAGKARRFLDVIFPLSSPGLLSGIIIVFVPAAGSFVEANLAGGTNGMLIGSYIDTNFSVSLNIGRGCALCVLFLLVLCVITLIINAVLRGVAGRRL